MKKGLLKILLTFLVLTLIFVLQKPVFMLFYSSIYSSFGAGEWLGVLTHGFAMDMTVAGYLTVVPALLTLIAVLTGFDLRGRVMRGYYLLVTLLIAAIQLLDLMLYRYWGFKLDTTPLFYFATSPAAAFASASTAEIIGGTVGLIALTTLYYLILRYTAGLVKLQRVEKKKLLTGGVLLGATALLFIPIRGGVTVSTMNLSRAYYSSVTVLNHAAVNPAFSLLYSATHQKKFDSQFRFFDNAEAERLFSESLRREVADSIASPMPLLKTSRPDIYLIILESFSSHLLPVQGGEPIAMKLDSIARDGLLLTNFYASGFRTDRALPAILSGFPSQPTTSVMKFVEKAEHLPSIAGALGEQGYSLSYYYGGDVNFTNMLAYLINSGFTNIVRDTDFPLSQRTGKWGAHDHLVYERCLADMSRNSGTVPRFTVIQSSSSHEPFKVPYKNTRFPEGPLRAFAYADSCVGAFVDSLSHTPRWDNTLVIMVPDHLGAYPRNLDAMEQRHHVPLIMTGGALNRRGEVDIVASQSDIAATLLAAMQVDHSRFKFSKNIFAAETAPSAFFSEPDFVGYVTDTDTVTINLSTMEPTKEAPQSAVDDAKAWLQTIYTELSRL
ncbi:MAG: sulfatase-like hydrolase/transferase [Muribaculaceae bacterium]|nr:sulfatase-like hydrolase/transferase [Muribaculaceae bacterium]